MSTAATAISDLLEETVPQFGGALLLCIDGRAGSGKSTVAAAVEADVDRIRIVHTDDLCPGWDGLPQVPRILVDLLAPLAAGRAGSYPRYDWHTGQVAEDVVVEPVGLLIVEGVGAGARALRQYRSALAWLECPDATRKDRAMTRDGDAFAPYWDAWAAAEDLYLRTEADRENADLVLRS